jgi:hypothetical protein
MTQAEFAGTLNNYHKDNFKQFATEFMHNITRLSMDLCSRVVTSLWGCSEVGYFGNNVYHLLETAASADPNVQLEPKLKTNSCTVYVIYPDQHAAVFALYKVEKYKSLNN